MLFTGKGMEISKEGKRREVASPVESRGILQGTALRRTTLRKGPSFASNVTKKGIKRLVAQELQLQNIRKKSQMTVTQMKKRREVQRNSETSRESPLLDQPRWSKVQLCRPKSE
jgi:uncharacterized sporulation protein YeaH/YhbH (DUF444 family)